MRSRIKEIDPGTPAGVKKWAEQQLAILETRRADLNLPRMKKQYETDEFQIQMWTTAEQDYLRIKGGCTDRKGFILVRDIMNPPETDDYYAYYNDGVVEEINPITGQPRPTPDPAKRTRGYVIPTQLTGEVVANSNAGKFSGGMRKVVGCYHVQGVNAPFSYAHSKTHGLLKFTVDGADQYWFAEISQSGVFVAPAIKSDSGNCCDSWSIEDYIPKAAQIAEQPSLQQYKNQLTLSWAFEEGKKGVRRLLDEDGISEAYSHGIPWHPGCGWAFSASGAEAQNVTILSTGTGASFRFLCSRFKLAFSLDAEGNPGVVLTTPDVEAVAQFPEFSGVWVPASDTQWFKDKGLTAAELAASIYTSQNAPMHVFYQGETEIVTRWSMSLTSLSSGSSGVGQYPRNYTGVPFMRSNNTTHIEPVCHGPNASGGSSDHPVSHELVISGDGLDGGNYIIHTGEVSYSGSITFFGAYFQVLAGFSSPLYGGVFERGTRTITRNQVVQGSDIVTVTEQDTVYGLNPDCYYDIIDPFNGNTVTITVGPIKQRSTSIKRNVHNKKDSGTEILTARTVLVPFLQEREAILYVDRNETRLDGTTTQEALVTSSNHLAHIKTTLEKIADIAHGGYPASVYHTPFVNHTYIDSTAIDVGGSHDSTVYDIDTFDTAAKGVLVVGPNTVSVTIPGVTTPGGTQPSSALREFLQGDVASPPEDNPAEALSPIMAMAGNSLPGEVGEADAVYLLEFADVEVLGGYDQIDSSDTVLAFVGRATIED